jgi:uncharacterized membrane protein YfhO
MISAEEAYIKSVNSEMEHVSTMIKLLSGMGNSWIGCPIGVTCETEFELIKGGYRLTKGNREKKFNIFGIPYDKGIQKLNGTFKLKVKRMEN